MTKDVLVTISGLHVDVLEGAGDNDSIEVITPGSYYLRNGKHYVLYEEVTEGIVGVTKNKIKITGQDSMEIIKSGVSNAHMVFEKHKTNQTYYDTPFGQMLVGVNTRNLEVSVTEKNIDVRIDYELDVNHEPLADCKIRMNITSKTGGDFSMSAGIPN
ncbi:DUF1934 domain-containing protein [Hespellia stercorisuis]|uniref:Uncharacterized beta-barrel protein YwiB, DUF1934 family n=1 Tax=Hespellia stercorisuis DSM 15480 TaxID=1121950 RepID=A0A1M6QKM5_9FIRM|nr:DUF1934 domain-containing protein [Hespellia stercorisuis]SHK20776.1 Uncharacterized beta-barrel protein YwiB, DUF1934 family [Hespellia stercorisuis DSM 15480]